MSMTKAHEVYPISSPRCRVSAPGHGETISRPPAFDGGAQRGDGREGCADRDSGALRVSEAAGGVQFLCARGRLESRGSR